MSVDLAPALFKVLPEFVKNRVEEEKDEKEREEEAETRPIEVVVEAEKVEGASESDSLKIQCVCSALEGRVIWAGFHKGRVGAYNTQLKQWTLCDETDKHALTVNALAYTPVGGGQVWSGSADGSLRVWSAQPKSATQALE